MTETLKAVALVIAGAVIGLLVSASGGVGFGGVYSNVQKDFSEGITVDGTTVIDGSRNFSGVDATLSGGNLVVTTGSGATSTIEVGAVETYATSSATKICIKPSTAGATSTFNGTLYFTYGECASL